MFDINKVPHILKGDIIDITAVTEDKTTELYGYKFLGLWSLWSVYKK
jgi:hypothetical protein